MAESRNVKKYTDNAVKASVELDREAYKHIKHMDKVTLSNYLVSIYQRGFAAGVKSMNDVVAAATTTDKPTETGKAEE